MVTIFSLPKPFTNPHIETIQTNAIRSWQALSVKPEIFLLGSDAGIAEICQKLNLRHLAEIETNSWGTPLVSAAFDQTRQLAKNQLLCYVNSDIILLNDFCKALKKVENLPRFLMVGRRIDLNVTRTLNFDSPSVEQLLLQTRTNGKLHPFSGMDFVVFPKNLVINMPRLAIGRPGWDNWLIYKARKMKLPVIDATAIVTAIHQNHDYSHHSQGKSGIFSGKEAQENFASAGGLGQMMTIRGANLLSTDKGLVPVPLDRRFYSWLVLNPILNKLLVAKRSIQNRLMN
ncbi:MAG TPA: hypothetical protein DDX47_00555 [Candidatus Jacksonbacteria bacterium]|nr:MAG: hypothetical protein A2295_04140 [Candidatus Jacksonbacteria bacterium RIFOXYB2_FULL_44_15]OGY82049.1 MAG: hypothetical protein A2550_00565 [Candidatus Jacksonbacteria bacterium RIFOXYD2_FULL_43_21]HBH45846.1 hypothetical protein [Candidatus Jacksonbacteria bacterium]HCC50449.1 hypothetical protein [Candidatus Jacksonbacteria bacterium]